MKAQELFDLAPLGARITYSDGTPKPPDRFKIKLRAWKSSNGSAYFVHANPGSGASYDHPSFTLMEAPREGGIVTLVVNRIFTPESKLDFEVEPPAPGTIIAYGRPLPGIENRGTVEVRHVWGDLNAARAWATRNRYVLGNCGLCYYRVADDGALVDFIPEG